MPIFKDERRTAGAVLAEMLQRDAAGEDVTELAQEFKDKSVAALDGYCIDFTVSYGESEK